MKLKMQGKEIIRRMQATTEGFRQTFKEKIYTLEEMQIKNQWVNDILKTRKDWVEWFRSIKSSNSVPNG